jgi:hypothetical protein
MENQNVSVSVHCKKESPKQNKGPFPIEKIKYDIITSIACLKKPILSILDLKYHRHTRYNIM